MRDLVVVGAGPAGLMAGKEAARAGVDTLVLDKKPVIGEPLRCGEAVNEFILSKLGLPQNPTYVSNTCKEVRVYSPSGREAFAKIPFEMLVLDRVRFEQFLARRAEKKGAEIRTRTVVAGLVWKKDHYDLKVRTPKGKKTVQARYVIGADGVECRIGRWAGLNNGIPIGEMGKAAMAIVRNVDVNKDSLYGYLGGKYCLGGYGWVFPKRNGEANIGLGFKASDKKTPVETLNGFLKKYYPKGKVVYRNVGCLPLKVPVERMHTRNLLITGDSAHLVTPATGGGIGYAMLSGRAAAQAISFAVNDPKGGELEIEDMSMHISEPKEALRMYTSVIRRMLVRKFERSYRLKERITKSDEEIERDFWKYKMGFSLIRAFPGMVHLFGKDQFF